MIRALGTLVSLFEENFGGQLWNSRSITLLRGRVCCDAWETDAQAIDGPETRNGTPKLGENRSVVAAVTEICCSSEPIAGIEADMFARVLRRILYAVRGSTYTARALGVSLGEGCRIYSSSFGTEPWLISIGDRVTVTSGVQFITHDGATWLLRDTKGRRYRCARIQIGSDVFIGTNSILLPGVRVGNRVIIGAGSVVNRSIPDNCVVAGVPARFIGTFDEFERRGLAEFSSDADKKGRSLREQIDSIVDETIAPEIEVPSSMKRQ